MTKIVILYVIMGSFTGMERISEYPDMAACKAAVASAQISLSDRSTFSNERTQSEWRTPKGDFLCIEGTR